MTTINENDEGSQKRCQSSECDGKKPDKEASYHTNTYPECATVLKSVTQIVTDQLRNADSD